MALMFGVNKHLSIARLMLVVSLAAAECALLRFVWETTAELAIVALPTLNFMLIGLWRLRPGHPARPFWIGFETMGMISIGLMAFLIWNAPQVLVYPFQWLINNKWFEAGGELVTTIVFILVMYALPPLLAAALVGWISGRYQVVIIRRPRRSEESLPRLEPSAEGMQRGIMRAGQAFADGSCPTVN